jgi:DNA-binding CsgD family transcriptional regulator
MSTTLERARRLVHELGETTSPDEYALVVVDAIWDLFPYDETRCKGPDRVNEVVYLERWPSVLPPRPTDHRFPDDGLPSCRGLSSGEAPVIHLSDRVNRRRLRSDPVYRELLEPLGCRYLVMVRFRQRSDTCRGLGIARSDRDFTDDELDLLILLAPHLEAEYRRATVASKLTSREREVMALVGDGLTNREIARRLDVAPGTVKAHLEHAYAKLGVGTRTGAIAALR